MNFCPVQLTCCHPVGLTGLDDATKRELQDVMDDFFAGTQAQVGGCPARVVALETFGCVALGGGWLVFFVP